MGPKARNMCTEASLESITKTATMTSKRLAAARALPTACALLLAT